MIKLYTIHCPACNILKKKMELKNIDFEVITDEEVFKEKEITVFPMLQIDDNPLMTFSEAVRWVNAREV